MCEGEWLAEENRVGRYFVSTVAHRSLLLASSQPLRTLSSNLHLKFLVIKLAKTNRRTADSLTISMRV